MAKWGSAPCTHVHIYLNKQMHRTGVGSRTKQGDLSGGRGGGEGLVTWGLRCKTLHSIQQTLTGQCKEQVRDCKIHARLVGGLVESCSVYRVYGY